MRKPINIRSASIETLQDALGKALFAKIQSQGSTKAFCEEHGVSRATLYRFKDGDGITLGNLIRILRGLNLSHLLQDMMAEPEASPVEAWEASQAEVKPSRSSIPNFSKASIQNKIGSRYER